MKKLIAMLLSLMMVLGCLTAGAEDLGTPAPATDTTVTITLDRQFMSGILNMLVDAENVPYAERALDVLEAVYLDVVSGDNVVDMALMANNTALTCLMGQVDEKGITYVGDLFPHYAIRLNFEDLSAFAQQSGMEVTLGGKPVSGEEALAVVQQVMGALEGYGADLSEYLKGLSGEVETSEDGTAQRLTLTTHHLAAMLDLVAVRLSTDETLRPLIEKALDQQSPYEEPVTFEEIITRLRDQAGRMLAEDPQVLGTVTVFQNEDGSMTVEVESNGKLLVSVDAANDEMSTVMDMMLLVSQEGTEDWNEVYKGLQDKTNFSDFGLDTRVKTSIDDDGVSNSFLYAEIMTSGWDVILSLLNKTAGYGTDAFYSYSNFGIDPGLTDDDVANIESYTVYADAPVMPSLEGLTVVNILTAAEEEQMALAKDVTTYGLPALVANAVLAMPDQAAAIMELALKGKDVSFDAAEEEETASMMAGIQEPADPDLTGLWKDEEHGATLTLNADGSCVLNIGGTEFEAEWTAQDSVITLKQGDIPLEGIYADELIVLNLGEYALELTR